MGTYYIDGKKTYLKDPVSVLRFPILWVFDHFFFFFCLCSHLENGLESTTLWLKGIIALSLFSWRVMWGLPNRESFIPKHRVFYFLHFLQHRIFFLPPGEQKDQHGLSKTTYPYNLLPACFNLQLITRTAPLTKKSWHRNWTESVSQVRWGESSK